MHQEAFLIRLDYATRSAAGKTDQSIVVCFTDREEREERKENIETNEGRRKDIPLPQNATEKPEIKVKPIWSAPSIQAVPHSVQSNVEDSPVKSLRKWVDGCFHNSAVPAPVSSSSPLSVTDTPPATPPHRTSTECPVITSGTAVWKC